MELCHDLRARHARGSRRARRNVAAALALALIVAANIVSAIAEAGFNCNLPENPTGYLSFR